MSHNVMKKLWAGTTKTKEGVRYERSTSIGWHTQGRVYSDIGRQARKMGRQRSPLCGLGDVSPQGITR